MGSAFGFECVVYAVYYKHAPSRPLSQGLSPPPPLLSERDGEDPAKEFACEISIELPFIWFLHRESKTW